jgi:hypothetical protein
MPNAELVNDDMGCRQEPRSWLPWRVAGFAQMTAAKSAGGENP